MSDQLRVARKQHWCTLCGESIEAGEHYVYQRITPWDHPLNEGFFSYRAHEECNRYWRAEYAHMTEHEFPQSAEGEFREYMQAWQREQFQLTEVEA